MDPLSLKDSDSELSELSSSGADSDDHSGAASQTTSKQGSKSANVTLPSFKLLATRKLRTWREVKQRSHAPGYNENQNKSAAWENAKARRKEQRKKETAQKQKVMALFGTRPKFLQNEGRTYKLREGEARDPARNGFLWARDPDVPPVQPARVGSFLQYGCALYESIGTSNDTSKDMHVLIPSGAAGYTAGGLLDSDGFESVHNLIDGDDNDAAPKTLVTQISSKGLVEDDEEGWKRWLLQKQVEFLLYLERTYAVSCEDVFVEELGFETADLGRVYNLS